MIPADAIEGAKRAVLLEMSDRRLLNDVDDDLHVEIAAAIVQACLPTLSCPDGLRLVPVDPTTEMVRRGEDALRKSGSGLSQLDGRKAADRIYRAMLAASPAPAVDNAGWRPIASAPKDGTRILAWHQNDWSRDPRWRVIYWTGAEGMAYRNTWLCDVCTLSVLERNILGWQPLPSAPSP